MKVKDRAKPKAPPVEPGVYPCVCVGIVDLGEQYSEKFKKYSNDVKIIWELVGEAIEVDGEQKPRQMSKDFSMSASKKSNLRKFISDWNVRQYSDEEFSEFELFDQLGRACQLQVVLSEDGEYSNIGSVMGLPKGMPAPVTATPLIKWDMNTWDDTTFSTFPEWIQEKIKKSTQYQKLHTPTDPIDFPEGAAPPPAGGACPI